MHYLNSTKVRYTLFVAAFFIVMIVMTLVVIQVYVTPELRTE
jgi:hypothetical protein